MMVLDGRMVIHYSNMLPLEIRLPAMALKDDKHWAIFLFLLETGEKRFGEIGNEFNQNSNNDLYPVLKDLVEGGLVRRYIKEGDEWIDKRATWYEVTDLGRKYLEFLEQLILPESVKEMKNKKSATDETGKFVLVATDLVKYKQCKKIVTSYNG